MEGDVIDTHMHTHMHAFTHSCEHTHAHAPKETLWEVISLPVPAMPGQPSGAATSLCPSVPRLCMVFLQAEREGESVHLLQGTHNTHRRTKGRMEPDALQYKQKDFTTAAAADS